MTVVGIRHQVEIKIEACLLSTWFDVNINYVFIAFQYIVVLNITKVFSLLLSKLLTKTLRTLVTYMYLVLLLYCGVRLLMDGLIALRWINHMHNTYIINGCLLFRECLINCIYSTTSSCA